MRELKRLFNRITERFGAEVLDTLRGEADTLLSTQRAWASQLEMRFKRTLTALLLKILEEESLRAQRRAGDLLTKQLTADESRTLPDILRQYLASHVASVWSNLASQIARDIVDKITEALTRGDTIDQMMQTVGTLLGTGVMEYRLERIVRTETTRAYNAAMLYETAPYPEVAAYKYLVVLDDRTSDVCRPIANKIVRKPLLRYMPPLHPNCRTLLLPLFEADLPTEAQAFVTDSDYGAVARRFGAVPQFLLERLAGLEQGTESFWDVWERHREKLYQFCLQATHGHEDDAKDLLSATMVRCFERYGLYDRTRSEFTTWAYKILQNLQASRRAEAARYTSLEAYEV